MQLNRGLIPLYIHTYLCMSACIYVCENVLVRRIYHVHLPFQQIIKFIAYTVYLLYISTLWHCYCCSAAASASASAAFCIFLELSKKSDDQRPKVNNNNNETTRQAHLHQLCFRLPLSLTPSYGRPLCRSPILSLSLCAASEPPPPPSPPPLPPPFTTQLSCIVSLPGVVQKQNGKKTLFTRNACVALALFFFFYRRRRQRRCL